MLEIMISLKLWNNIVAKKNKKNNLNPTTTKTTIKTSEASNSKFL